MDCRGKWNPAILTPKGIAEQIFNKTDDVPFEVLVPLDTMGPPKVRIEGLLVSANFDRFVIDCEKSDWELLEKSKEYCRKAIDALPKTPVSAAGFNIRYQLEEPAEEFLELLKPSLDDSCYVPQYLAQARPVSPGLFDLAFFETPPIPPLET